jgi:hypothetical protein
MGNKLNLKNILKNGKVYVWEGTYAMVKAERPCRGAAAVIRDRNEITCLVEESSLRPAGLLAVDAGWKVITFDMILPFGLIGFLARVSGTLAKAGISICALSAYSTDHILVKTKDLEKALACMEQLGFMVEGKKR